MARLRENLLWSLAALLLGGLAQACGSDHDRGDLAGHACPCLPGWVCDQSQGSAGVCVQSALGAEPELGLTSTPVDDGAGGPSTLVDPAVDDPGAAAVAGAPECVAAEATGSGCPAPCTDCSDGVCHIRCSTPGACSGTRPSTLSIECPAGFHCELSCASDDTCTEATVRCSGDQSCAVLCTGKKSCQELNVACAGGPCSLHCANQAAVCRHSELACGAGACQAVCEGTEKPAFTSCEASCSSECGC